MEHWKSKFVALIAGFITGLLVLLIYSFFVSFIHRQILRAAEPLGKAKCSDGDRLTKPEEVLSALRSDEVNVRREVYGRLFFRPGMATAYYDYERDKDYPPRAEFARLQYVQLDDASEPEALITFVRFENPVAVVLKKSLCGWNVVVTLGSWLRFEEYPYAEWLELPETIKPGVHELLIHESVSDATRYVRTARLLKLIDGSLQQIASYAEDEVTPLENYRAPDWSDVKHHRARHGDFVQGTAGQTARLHIETVDEVLEYSGVAPTYTYWPETDGAWHSARKHWNRRPAARLKLLDSHTEEFTWNEGKKRFVENE